MPRIERPAPPYVQVTDHYRRQIVDGTLAEGAKLPSVAEVAKTWQIAHATAAKAMTQLQVEGLIVSSPRGSFVAGKASKANSPQDRVQRLHRSGTLDAANEHHRVLAAEVVQPPTYVSDLLGLDYGVEVVRREFVTIEDGNLRALTVTWYPADLVEPVPLLLSKESSKVGVLLGQIEQVTGQVSKGRDFYHARGADAREASALGLTVGAAILAGAWLMWSTSGGEERLVEYGEACFPPRSTVSYPYDVQDEPSAKGA